MSIFTPGGRFLGARRDGWSPKDFIYQPGSHLLDAPMPSKFDADANVQMPPIFDQLQEGSCTGNAYGRKLEGMMLKFPQWKIPYSPVSRQQIYWCERNLPWNNDTDQDNGANMRDGAIVLETIGACAESFDPYGPSTLTTAPTPAALADAAKRKIGAYHRIVSLDDMKGCLVSGYSFALGFQVYESFEEVGADGIWKPDVETESVVGGHAVYCHGYDDSVNGGSLLIDNSWGADWGREGSFWMPYSFVNNYTASGWDAWVGHFGPPWKPAQAAA